MGDYLALIAEDHEEPMTVFWVACLFLLWLI
jgi:hypothetical protein